jgi:serine/threonine-protein kinase
MPNGQYQIGELLGQGGMGQVHVARHRSGRIVAVKRVRNTLSSDQGMAARLADEARLLRAVSHPNVVRALDHGTGCDGQPFLVMDRAHGTPLNAVIARCGPLGRERIIAIASQLFAGLAAIHAAGIIHADLKSHNVLVDDVDIVTIIDFGLARTVAAPPEPDGPISGTPVYMAPEVIAGASPRIASDIYAAATILYEMLTATTPYTGHISTILARQLSEPVEPPSQRAPDRGISPKIDRVVLRALDPSPDARYPSVAAFAAAFDAALAAPAASTPQPTERLDPQRVEASTGLAGVHGLRAFAGQDPTDAIISAALTKALPLIEDHRLTEAVHALEAALAALVPALDHDAPSCADAWRLETVLAALYGATGKQDRARRMALVAYRHALCSGCDLAKTRARELVDRLVVRPRRVARGTAGGPR